ncbi:MAG: hypothetical protein E7277_08930 [Lachnospiraceae bacterium]|nr:hypothetical protein [Lachnospiraceae bacterium]
MRKICVGTVAVLLCCVLFQTTVLATTNYEKYSNASHGWGLTRNRLHKTPGGVSTAKSLKKYGAYYYGDTSRKVCYLTFDCGYENGNTKGILDVLKRYHIRAVFFVTEPFVKAEPALVKRMKAEGHLVGNHTKTHPRLPDCSVRKIKREVRAVEKAVKECTGEAIDKILRPPEGAYSQRVLKVLSDMGYKTLFWSNAWFDWDVNHQPSVDSVVGQFRTYYHNGMVPLMHNTSSADRKALPRAIRFLKSRGFTFERFDTVYKKNPKLSIRIKNYTYDGKRASAHLTIKTKSKGAIKTYFYKGKTKLKKAPKDAGKYLVKVVQTQTKTYKEVTASKTFRITKAKPEIRIVVAQSEKGVDVDIFCENRTGERRISFYNQEGILIEQPTSPGEYFVVVKIGATKNYKAASKKLHFQILINQSA